MGSWPWVTVDTGGQAQVDIHTYAGVCSSIDANMDGMEWDILMHEEKARENFSRGIS